MARLASTLLNLESLQRTMVDVTLWCGSSAPAGMMIDSIPTLCGTYMKGDTSIICAPVINRGIVRLVKEQGSALGRM